MNHEVTVFVVDDDESLRKSLRRLLESSGFLVETFESAEAFLADYDVDKPGCLILDVKMPGMNGLELQDKLANVGSGIPVIIISASGEVDSTVRAMKQGAVDFLQKPYKGKLLLECVRRAVELDAQRREKAMKSAQAVARLDLLTPREVEVMGHLVVGKATKQIAYELGLSRKTVDVHRCHIMTKLQANSVVDLVRIWPG